MRIAGVRLGAPVARLLSDILTREGYRETAARIGDAIERGITTEVPLTTTDHRAILEALTPTCPASLRRLRDELAKDQRYVRKVTGG